MAERRGKFAALAELRQRSEVTESDLPPPAAPVIAEMPPAKGRPATGKRSNPDWKLYSHFLKRKTQREAVMRLKAEDQGQDLSDILQELLENWLESRPLR